MSSWKPQMRMSLPKELLLLGTNAISYSSVWETTYQPVAEAWRPAAALTRGTWPVEAPLTKKEEMLWLLLIGRAEDTSWTTLILGYNHTGAHWSLSPDHLLHRVQTFCAVLQAAWHPSASSATPASSDLGSGTQGGPLILAPPRLVFGSPVQTVSQHIF